MMCMIEVKIDEKLRRTYGDRNTQVAWQWCVDTFGAPPHNMWAFDSGLIFRFHNAEDAALFKLRWT
jgi:hypothetical protein